MIKGKLSNRNSTVNSPNSKTGRCSKRVQSNQLHNKIKFTLKHNTLTAEDVLSSSSSESGNESEHDI